MADPDDLLETIPEILEYRSAHDSDRNTFQFYNRRGFASNLNPKDVYTMAGKFAHLLKSWGFEKGEVIANGLPNSPERVVTDFGVIMSGCVLANCQAIEKDGRDFWHTARISHCRGVILSARPDNAPHRIFSSFLPPEGLDASSSTNMSSDGYGINIAPDVSVPQAPTIRKVILCGRNSSLTKPDEESQEQKDKTDQQQKHPNSHSLLEALKSMDDVTQFFQAVCDPKDLVLLLSTSGTTGFNKLVPATHKYLLDTGRVFQKQSRDILNYNDRPLGWMGGYPLDFLASGSCRVLQDFFNNEGAPTPKELWDAVSASKCQGVALMPYDVMRLVDEFEHNPPEYKAWYIVTGGQVIRKDLSKCQELLSSALIVSYGCSEGGMFTLGIFPIEQAGTLEEFYCGKIQDKENVHIKIVGEDGQDLGTDDTGEIYVKCDRIIKSYYNLEAPNSTSERHPDIYTEDGWFKTGDRGKLLSDGSLYCYGRQGDVTSINGVIIYLSWLESILNKCEGIQNSSVIAVGDDVNDRKKSRGCDENDSSAENSGGGGISFCGFVEKKKEVNLTEEEVKEFFVDNLLDTEYKDKLKLSYVFIVDTLPLIPSRKINKRALLEIANEKLKL